MHAVLRLGHILVDRAKHADVPEESTISIGA